MECIKFFIREGVNERKCENGWQFFLRTGTGPHLSAIRLKGVTTKNSDYRLKNFV